MPVYEYKAVSQSGENIVGNYSAPTKEQVLHMLREHYYYPVKIEEVVEGKDIQSFSPFRRVKTKDIAVFCRQFYAMLNAGITVLNGLDILRVQTESKKLRRIIGKVYEDVQKGLTLSEGLKAHDAMIPKLLIHMVEVGEVSGNLDDIMNRMAIYYEKETKIQDKLAGAMVYPILLSIVSTIVVIFLLTFIMPTFIGMFEGSGVELPLPTRILLTVSYFLEESWYIALFGLGFIGLGIKKYAQSSRGQYLLDRLKLQIPVVKDTTQKVITARFTRTLSILLSSGVSLIQSLEVVSKIVGNKVVEEGILMVKEEVRKGVDLAEPIQKLGFFPPMIHSMIRIGEESGVLDEILDKTANYYDDEAESALQKMTTLFEPLMIIIMAVVIGGIVVAMALPMFDMINTVQM